MVRQLWVIAACAAVSPVSSAFAQAPAPAHVVAGAEGFAIETADGDVRLQIGLIVHADGRFVPNDDERRVVDTFAFRRLRPYLRGRLSRRVEFTVVPDFAGSTLVVQDAYVDAVFTPAFRIRVGKGKTPFGMERLHSASNLMFFSRALPTALAPNRDIGLQVLGDVGSGLVSYAAGLMNGVTDGGSADVDTTDGKDLSARIVVRPFTKTAVTPLRGVGLALSGSRGRPAPGAVPEFRTPSADQLFFSYDGVLNDGVRVRYSPQFFYYFKAFGGFSEYTRTEVPMRKALDRADIRHDAWQVAVSYVLTGETATDSAAGIRPRTNAEFGHGSLGAFQVAARYHTLQLDRDAFALGFASPGSSGRAEAWTVGLNWCLTPNLRYTYNFERTVFDSGADGARRREDAFVFRTQVAF
jgi:phosphate-selective porin OprO and OprP